MDINISYQLRNPSEKKPQRIWAVFYINGKRIKIDTHRTIEPKDWSTANKKTLGTFKHSTEYNKYLKEFKDNIDQICRNMQSKKIRVDKDKVQSEIDNLYKINPIEKGKGEIVDFISFIDNYIAKKTGLARTTISVLKQVRVNLLFGFNLVSKKEKEHYLSLGNKKRGEYELQPEKTIDFDTVNIDLYTKFKEYLDTHTYEAVVRGERKMVNYKLNYVSKQMKVFKQFIDAAIEAKYVEDFKIVTIKIKTEDVDSVYLNYDELQKWLDLDLTDDKMLAQCRDKFVLNCFLGFRYSDLNNLEKHFFTEETIQLEDGTKEKFLIYSGRNIKTKNKIRFAVHKTAEKLLRKYKLDLPKIPEATYNEALKKIAIRAGMNQLVRIRETRGNKEIHSDVPKWQLISSHTGRRSFCTNFFEDGVATQAIMSISGHKTEREFRKYINNDAAVKISVVAQQVNNIRKLTF